VGLGVVQEIALVGGLPAAPPAGVRRAAFGLGVCVIAAAGALVAGSAASIRRGGSPARAAHVLAATLFGFLIATALYVDLPGDSHKRYDFVFVLVPLLVAAAVGVFRDRLSTRALRLPVGLSLGLVAMIQVAYGASANREWHRLLPTMKPLDYFGRANESWFSYLRNLRRSRPTACGYVFSLEELRHARYQLEIVASLWSELPSPVAIGDPSLLDTWDRPIPVRSAAAFRTEGRGCEWLSDHAQKLLSP
jgi:hypothetical protein